MNPLYDQIQLTHQEDGYHLMGFEGTDAGVLSFKTGLEGDESGTWQKVQAVVDGTPIEGYVNLDHSLLGGRIANLPNST